MRTPRLARGERDQIAATYRRYATNPRRRRAWAADNSGNVAIRRELLTRVREAAASVLASDGRILDVGCGGGWWLEALAGDGVAPMRLHGVDLLPERIETAVWRVPEADVRIADATSLPHGDSSMELVLLFIVLSSVSRDSGRRILEEVRRVVAPGGRVLVYEPRVPNVFNPATRLVRRAEVAAVLGPPVHSRSLTTLPPLVRRLGRLALPLYPHLRRIPLLRTHRLSVFIPGERPFADLCGLDRGSRRV